MAVGAHYNDGNGVNSGRARFYTKWDPTGEPISVPSSIPSLNPSSAPSEEINTVLYYRLSETPSRKLSRLLYLYPSYYLSE